MRVAVLGSAGQLGTELMEVLSKDSRYEAVALSHADVDITSPAAVRRVLQEARPNVVVNCAALRNVDGCEEDPEDAFRVNAVGARHVAQACTQLGSLAVHISTDFVFDGEKGSSYQEEDAPRPVNAYGSSKLAGEHMVQQACDRWLIVRVASLFGIAGRERGGNFIESIVTAAHAGRHLKIVDDVWMSPTSARDAARALESLLRHEATGLFHLVNSGACTWYEFAMKALELAGIEAEVEPTHAVDYPYKARRPRNSCLDNSKATQYAASGLQPWPDALEAYLVERAVTAA